MSKKLKVAFCAGHGSFGVTPGKRTPDGEYEWDFNDVVAREFEKVMKTYKGVSLLRTDDRSGKTDVPLRDRTNRANRWGADIYISFHHNAFRSRWESGHTGVETYYYKGSVKGRELAEVVQKALVEAYGLRDRGLKTDNLFITRETKMTAVLAEGGFMDSTIDIKKLRDESVLKSAGRGVAHAVAKLYGLTSGSKTTKKPSKTTTKTSTQKKTAAPKIAVGNKVTLSKTASKYATGQTIPSKYRGKSYTIQQVGNGRVLLKELYSWVYTKDIVGVVNSKSTTKKSTPKKSTSTTIKVGSKVTLSKNATRYATGERIPSSIKGKRYTVQQVKSDRVLLKEIYSWVLKKDVGGSTTPTKKSRPTKKNTIKSVGKIKLDRIKNFTYIYEIPNSNSTRLGKAKVNSVYDIAGSVVGWYEVIYKGRRAYIRSKYASRI